MVSTLRGGLTLAMAAAIGALSATARAETVVQVPLPDLLDARSVTTLTNGNLVVFTLPTDGGMLQNAFATQAVATLKGKPTENALPDDGKFPANDRHPDVVLHFSNDTAPTSPQTHLVKPTDEITFPVPVATYSKFFLFVNGAAGGTKLTITLSYEDAMDVQSATVPDYYADVSASDPVIFNLATNLAKWDRNTAINEAGHHNITGVTLTTLADKKLTSIKVARSLDGNLVFWGATGVATSDIAGMGGSGGAGGAASGGVGGAAAGTGGTVAGASTGGVSVGGTSGGLDSGGGAAGGNARTATGGVAGVATAGTASIQPPPSSSADTSCSCRAAGRASNRESSACLLLFGALALALNRARANSAGP
jgi:hypothetical protein